MQFLVSNGILIYFIIFFGKIIEVTMMTIRIVLINRGEKLKGAFIGFFEVLIWLTLISSVLTDIKNDYFKGVVYALAFAVGNYLGVIVENKLAIGLSSIQVIIPKDSGQVLAEILREQNFGVTILEGEGRINKKDILIIHLKRKRINLAIKLIQQNIKDAVITVNDVKLIHGGFIRK